VLWVALAEKTAAAFRCLIEHAVSARVWRPVGHTVLYHVNIDAGPKRTVEILALNPLYDFFIEESERSGRSRWSRNVASATFSPERSEMVIRISLIITLLLINT
jgi:hypothetical protein